MRIVVGTYDGALLGWETDASDATGRSLRLAYAFGAHDSAIKALAIDEAKGNTLVTGCGDETMRVYSLKHHREVGTLNVHSDAVGALAFFGGSNLLSASRDGGVCIWRATDWTNLEVMRGHKCVRAARAE
jgi:protein MAK11